MDVRMNLRSKNTPARTPARSRLRVPSAISRLLSRVIWILTFVQFTRKRSIAYALFAINLSLKSGIGEYTFAKTRTNSQISTRNNISRGREILRERERESREIKRMYSKSIILFNIHTYTISIQTRERFTRARWIVWAECGVPWVDFALLFLFEQHSLFVRGNSKLTQKMTKYRQNCSERSLFSILDS